MFREISARIFEQVLVCVFVVLINRRQPWEAVETHSYVRTLCALGTMNKRSVCLLVCCMCTLRVMNLLQVHFVHYRLKFLHTPETFRSSTIGANIDVPFTFRAVMCMQELRYRDNAATKNPFQTSSIPTEKLHRLSHSMMMGIMHDRPKANCL